MGIFQDKIAIITGGASGIGRAVAEALAGRGAKVVLADRNASLLQEVAEAIKTVGGAAQAVPLDVTDAPAVKALVDDTVSAYGRLDYVFNNAGVVVFGEARDYTYEDWRRVIDVDFLGVVNGVAAAYPVMVRQGFGHIVNTASAAGLIPVSHMASYVASKHGVVGLSYALRMEGAALGVKVSVVCPGIIRTPMYYSPTIKINQKKLLEQAPQGYPPEKCANAILTGVACNQAAIVVTPTAKITAILFRISPVVMLWVGEQIVKIVRRRLRVEK